MELLRISFDNDTGKMQKLIKMFVLRRVAWADRKNFSSTLVSECHCTSTFVNTGTTLILLAIKFKHQF